MGHIFISYSHKDREYVHKLQKALQNEGFDVWIDDRIDYGTTWPKIIQENLDNCSAFIVVMTEDAYASKWVHNEVTRAERKEKPFYALLLSGDTWLSLEAVQYENVTGGKLPSEKFYETLAQVTQREEKTLPPVSPGRPFISRDALTSMIPKIFPAVRLVGILLIVGAIIWGGSLAIPALTSVVPTTTVTTTFKLTPKPIIPSQTLETFRPSETVTMTLPPAEIPIPTVTPLPTEITDIKGIQMILVPAGEFTMGDNLAEDDEKPEHIVSLDGYYFDKYEVTNLSYKGCVDAGVCSKPFDENNYNNIRYVNHPVVFINWTQAESFCQWREARLPTEAEWEKAARGTDTFIYPWGNSADPKNANYFNIVNNTSEVGVYEDGRSTYGIYDLAGNVWEWVADIYDPVYYYSLPQGVKNPPGPNSLDKYRVIRGGSWNDNADVIRSSNRSRLFYTEYGNDLGFRCARDATE